ncbi:MAG: type II toxin-antitoxin system VapC family toxin [Verrucomicrobiota bacterium]|nr:type II toxin-antitoxin system VapC family toxin [Verrucomicrobiota bacterium]
MQLTDVNVLVNAFRPEAPHHVRYRAWLEQLIAGDQRYGMSELILSSVVRILTNRQIYARPDSIETALGFAELLKTQRLCVLIAPGPRHWQIFSRMCVEAKVRGAMVSDAYWAALAIEHGCEWITADRGFARFPGLRWRHPLD